NTDRLKELILPHVTASLEACLKGVGTACQNFEDAPAQQLDIKLPHAEGERGARCRASSNRCFLEVNSSYHWLCPTDTTCAAASIQVNITPVDLQGKPLPYMEVRSGEVEIPSSHLVG